MSLRTRLAATPLACLLLLITTGCPPMTPGGNGNTNGGGNGNTNGGANGNTNGSNGNGNGGGMPAELTEEQAAAIDAAFNDMVAFYTLFGSFHEMSNTRLAIGSLPQIDTFGDCPTVSIVKGAASAVIAVDFDSGCETDATGGLTVVGGLDVRVTLETAVTTVDLLGLSIEGVGYEGMLTFTQTRDDGTLTLTGETDGVTIEGVGDVSGDLTVILNREGEITIKGTLTIDDGTTVREISIDGVEIDPAANGNFLPSNGAMTFTQGEAELLVTFNADTPATREVQVSINGSAEATYEVR